MNDDLVVCENLVRIYKVADLEVVALQGLDLTVKRGEMLGIVGNSGSGKSTLMNILGGLDYPSAGRVSVDGVDLLGLKGRLLNEYLRKKVGFVWQQTSRNLVPYLTAQENVELPMTVAWTAGASQKRKWSGELLEAVGLSARRHHKLGQLSGGEQQRVAIAVALANKPVLLLGDEPTGEVDSVTAQAIMDTFRKLATLMDLTIIIVTHDPRVARQVDRVVAIRDGKISTETIRQVGRREAPAAWPEVVQSGQASESTRDPAAQEEKEPVTYQEYVVLDSAGRLQIPREWLEKLRIGKRVELDLEGDGIRIQPVVDSESETKNKPLTLEEQLALLFSEEPPPQRKSLLRGLMNRLPRGKEKSR
jgi:putative ABC transport system ATP-binding protein